MHFAKIKIIQYVYWVRGAQKFAKKPHFNILQIHMTPFCYVANKKMSYCYVWQKNKQKVAASQTKNWFVGYVKVMFFALRLSWWCFILQDWKLSGMINKLLTIDQIDRWWFTTIGKILILFDSNSCFCLCIVSMCYLQE